MTIGGKDYVYQGVTDLEVMPLAEVFGTERPEEGTKEYRDWEKQFMRRFADYSSQRAIAFFLLCAFPDLPESIVKYTVRRMPDGTEECKPGRDLRVKLEAKDFEQIVLIISSELRKIEQKLNKEHQSRIESVKTQTDQHFVIKRKKPEPFVLDDADAAPDLDQEKSNFIQGINSQELLLAVNTILEHRQNEQDSSAFWKGRAEARVK